MKRFTAAQARQQFSAMLDAAARGERVIIERAGVQFGVQLQEAPKPATRRAPLVKWMAPEISEGEWTWDIADGEARLSARKRRRK